MKQLIIAFLLVTATLFANAQTVIKPGDKSIRYDWIKPSHDFYKNIITDTAGKVLHEFMMEDITTIDSVKKQIVFARSRQVPIGFFSTDTSFTDLQLKPIRMHEIHYQYNVSFEMTFGDTQATVKATKKGAVAYVKNFPMSSGYFEDNMTEYIFGYLDLKKGISYTLDNFNKDTPKPSNPFVLEYVFDDVLQLTPGHNLECAMLHFTHGDTTGYVWIDKSTHLMIKMIGNFKGGRFVLTKV